MEKPSVEEFRDWIKNARAGQVYIYHTGFLANDRGIIIDNPDGEPLVIPNGNIHELGQLAVHAFDNAMVHLFQRKLHDSVYQYIAMKRSRYGRNW